MFLKGSPLDFGNHLSHDHDHDHDPACFDGSGSIASMVSHQHSHSGQEASEAEPGVEGLGREEEFDASYLLLLLVVMLERWAGLDDRFGLHSTETGRPDLR